MIKIIGYILTVVALLTLFSGPSIFKKIKKLDELTTEQVMAIKILALVEATIAFVLICLIK